MEKLASAEITDVPRIVAELGPYRRWAKPRLRQMAVAAPPDSRQRLLAALALLPTDAGQVDYLCQRLLTARPEELPILRDALQGRQDQVTDRLWEVAADASADRQQRFRAAYALAAYDPDSPRWAPVSADVTATLVTENLLYLRLWAEALRPARAALVGPLAAVFRDGKRPESERARATTVLADYAADRPEVLAELIKDADSRQYAELLPKLLAHSERAVPLLQTEAEWEYACRAGAATSRFYGASAELLGQYAWYFGNSGECRHPVGLLKPNDHGLFDLYGNVLEWTNSQWLRLRPKVEGEIMDINDDDIEHLQTPIGAQPRVLRGGAFSKPPSSVRSALRSRYAPTIRADNVGFRVARTVP